MVPRLLAKGILLHLTWHSVLFQVNPLSQTRFRQRPNEGRPEMKAVGVSDASVQSTKPGLGVEQGGQGQWHMPGPQGCKGHSSSAGSSDHVLHSFHVTWNLPEISATGTSARSLGKARLLASSCLGPGPRAGSRGPRALPAPWKRAVMAELSELGSTVAAPLTAGYVV